MEVELKRHAWWRRTKLTRTELFFERQRKVVATYGVPAACSNQPAHRAKASPLQVGVFTYLIDRPSCRGPLLSDGKIPKTPESFVEAQSNVYAGVFKMEWAISVAVNIYKYFKYQRPR
jgi:hypothetical protein